MTLIGGGFVSFWGPVLGGSSTSSRATCSAPTPRLAAVVRPDVHGGRDVQARRGRRHLAGRGRACAPAPAGFGHPAGGAEETMALFEARHLHKRFGDQRRARGHHARVRAGAAVRHHGPERRRQDDLLQRADRPLPARPRPGLFDGEDITGLSPHAIARRGIARSFQLMNLFDDYSALENVLFALPEVRRRGLDCWRPPLDDGARLRARAAGAARGASRSAAGAGAAPRLRRAAGARDRRGARRATRACCSSTSRPRASAWGQRAAAGAHAGAQAAPHHRRDRARHALPVRPRRHASR